MIISIHYMLRLKTLELVKRMNLKLDNHKKTQ